MVSIGQAVADRRYPGRGIVMGLSRDGTKALFGYFIMGRSQNSRNRVFVPHGTGIRTEAFDPAKLVDSSLIIYAPVRVWENSTIVTNGDQTDTIYDFVSRGGSFINALLTREFEPDAPNYTPRISGMATIEAGKLKYVMSILRRGANGDCQRPVFSYDAPIPGEGRFLHTYHGDGDPLPSFQGEPRQVALPNDAKAMQREIWEGLDPDNRVSLFVRSVELSTGEIVSYIINKHEKGMKA